MCVGGGGGGGLIEKGGLLKKMRPPKVGLIREGGLIERGWGGLNTAFTVYGTRQLLQFISQNEMM